MSLLGVEGQPVDFSRIFRAAFRGSSTGATSRSAAGLGGPASTDSVDAGPPGWARTPAAWGMGGAAAGCYHLPDGAVARWERPVILGKARSMRFTVSNRAKWLAGPAGRWRWG